MYNYFYFQTQLRHQRNILKYMTRKGQDNIGDNETKK